MVYIVFATEGFLQVARKSWYDWDLNPWPNGIWYRRSNQLRHQAMSSTRTRSQLCRATPISFFVHCQISLWLLSLSVALFFVRGRSIAHHLLLKNLNQKMENPSEHFWRTYQNILTVFLIEVPLVKLHGYVQRSI